MTPNHRHSSAPDVNRTTPPSHHPTGHWETSSDVTTFPGQGPARDQGPAAVFGPYELLGEVARGGMGVVYRARQRGLDRVVALKMILGAHTDRSAERFAQEARAAAALDHPNVVPIYDIGEADGRMYFTMAFVEGTDLKGHVDAHGVPPAGRALALFTQVVAGVAHAHRLGVIHRDLKPANVLVDRDGRARVTDFGLAKRLDGDSQLTGTGQVMGTPAYMPPEQARGARDVGPTADVYSLGAILYFLLTGRPPFEGQSIPDLLIKVVSEPPEPPRASNPEVPPEVEAVCLRCLAKNPADRYPDAQALLGELLPVAERYSARSSQQVPAFAAADVGVTRTMASATAAVPAAPAKPWKVFAGLALVLAVSAAALVAFFRPPAAAPDPGPSTADSGMTTRPAVVPPGEAAVSAPVGEAVWPPVSRTDFGLTVELVAPARKDARGVFLLADKTPLEIRIRAERDCRAAVYALDPRGQAVRLFPNEYDRDDRLAAGAARAVPGNREYALETTPTAGDGVERLRVIATTGDMPAPPPGQRVGAYTAYATEPERRQLAASVRGVVLKKSAGARAPDAPEVAEAEILYHVGP